MEHFTPERRLVFDETVDFVISVIQALWQGRSVVDWLVMDEDEATSRVHFTLGMVIRNSCGLWCPESVLYRWFMCWSVLKHSDDMSQAILLAVHRKMRGEDISSDRALNRILNWSYSAKGEECTTMLEKVMEGQVGIPVKVKLTKDGSTVPIYSSELANGADLVSAEEVIIFPGKVGVIGTGLVIDYPAGYDVQIRSRSGLAAKHGVFVLNSPGTIDPDYHGEIKVILLNTGDRNFKVTVGMRIAQMLVAPVCRCDFQPWKEVKETERGAGGLGSTGV